MIRYYNAQKLVKRVEKTWKIWLDIIMPKNWLNGLNKREKWLDIIMPKNRLNVLKKREKYDYIL